MQISKVAIGTMRLRTSETGIALIRKAIDYGFNYIDTAPLYMFKNETQNSETWVGEALRSSDYRNRALISAKSATSNGGLELGDFKQQIGFGVRTAGQFRLVFEQSLKRLKVNALDYYHLWICHTDRLFREAFKPDGWYKGFQNEKDAGRVKHLGLSSHADANTIIEFLSTGFFETITIPLNVLNTSRLKVVEYCKKNNIKVIAMNPLGGGFLAADERLLKLAYRYLLSLENVHMIIGFTTEEQVKFANDVKIEFENSPTSAENILKEAIEIIPSEEPKCTGCGYCQPCPNFIEIGASLSLYNLYKYLNIAQAKNEFQHLQRNPRFQLNNCTECVQCEKRCPNMLPVKQIIQDAKKIMYDAN